MIRAYFKVGSIIKNGDNGVLYRVSSIKELWVIIDHFDKNPLITQKRADYELWKQAVELMKSKEHLTPTGFQRILALKASMNKGLSDDLKAAFPNTIPVRPQVRGQVIKDLAAQQPHIFEENMGNWA